MSGWIQAAMQQNTIVDKELENLQVNQVSLNLFICTFPKGQ